VAPDAGPAARAPNIVVVMTDDQDVASMDLMPIVRRELIDEGVEFTNSFVGLSECCPSRATYLTGRHAHNHGVLSNKLPSGGYPALDNEHTLPVWLRAAGYRTGQVGRYLNYYGNSQAGTDPLEIPPGWDDWHVPVEHTEFRMYGYTLNENGRLVDYGNAQSDYSTDVLRKHAIEFIDRSAARAKPFFLSVTPTAPHTEGVLEGQDAPRDPRPAPRDLGEYRDLAVPRPPSFAEADLSDKPRVVQEIAERKGITGITDKLRANYLGRVESLLAVDRMVGGLVEALRRNRELRDTLIIYTSDNGFMLGEHGLAGKHLPYEESIRVPLVMRGPGLPSGEAIDGMVQNIDLAPTILDAAGIPARRKQDGVSMLRLSTGGGFDEDRHLLIEYLESPERFKSVRSPDGFLYAEYAKGAVELYDLNRDPFQLENVAEARRYTAVEKGLAERLEALRDCAGRACR
jgi:arylsulfatase A-like enzyme